MQVFCIVQIFKIHSVDFLCYMSSKIIWSQNFHVITKGEYQGFKLFVDFDIDADNGMVRHFLNNSLGEM